MQIKIPCAAGSASTARQLSLVLPLWGSQASLKIHPKRCALSGGSIWLVGAGSQGNQGMLPSKAVSTQCPRLHLEEEKQGTSGRASQKATQEESLGLGLIIVWVVVGGL